MCVCSPHFRARFRVRSCLRLRSATRPLVAASRDLVPALGPFPSHAHCSLPLHLDTELRGDRLWSRDVGPRLLAGGATFRRRTPLPSASPLRTLPPPPPSPANDFCLLLLRATPRGRARNAWHCTQTTEKHSPIQKKEAGNQSKTMIAPCATQDRSRSDGFCVSRVVLCAAVAVASVLIEYSDVRAGRQRWRCRR